MAVTRRAQRGWRRGRTSEHGGKQGRERERRREKDAPGRPFGRATHLRGARRKELQRLEGAALVLGLLDEVNHARGCGRLSHCSFTEWRVKKKGTKMLVVFHHHPVRIGFSRPLENIWAFVLSLRLFCFALHTCGERGRRARWPWWCCAHVWPFAHRAAAAGGRCSTSRGPLG